LSANHTHPRQIALLTATVLLVLCLFATGAAAADRETLCSSVYCFSQEDFAAAGDPLTGIFITDVPAAAVGRICYGSRVLCAGDALPVSALGALTLSPTGQEDSEAELGYLPVTASGVGEPQKLTVKISSGKNEAPTAKDGTLETYKNVANAGKLEAADPEQEKLRYDLTGAPKRGTVEIADDGTFTYTPAKNKVGKDSFTFTATDPAGNVSNAATICIEILKPESKQTYADMRGDTDQFTALWLKNTGLFAGENIAGTSCFCPDKVVTRGEFLVMVSRLTGLEPDDAKMTSGFADEAATPAWMRPYIVSALRAGVISGVSSDHGLVFRPDTAVTRAEAAVMLRNLLKLPSSEQAASFPDDAAVPAWAESAVSSLSNAGIPLDSTECMQSVTRRDAARMLYAVSRLDSVSEKKG